MEGSSIGLWLEVCTQNVCSLLTLVDLPECSHFIVLKCFVLFSSLMLLLVLFSSLMLLLLLSTSFFKYFVGIKFRDVVVVLCFFAIILTKIHT